MDPAPMIVDIAETYPVSACFPHRGHDTPAE
jgi:hypothetical protein